MNTHIDKDLYIGRWREDTLPANYQVIYKGHFQTWNGIRIYNYIRNRKLPIPEEFNYGPGSHKYKLMNRGEWTIDLPNKISQEASQFIGNWNEC
jgi:hypothetical protein